MKDLEMQSETARGHSSSCLRMLLVLPLLPADYIRSGLEAVKKWAQEKKVLSRLNLFSKCSSYQRNNFFSFLQIFSTQMNSLCTYIEKKWIRAVGAEKISIFGLPNSIHNHIQTFNNELKNAIGTANTIWHMLGMLNLD